MAIFAKRAVDIFAAQDASGSARKVANHDVQVWGTEVERTLTAFQAGGGVIFQSKSQADANLGYDANTMAWVFDGNPSLTGIYQKQGASGSGSWVKRGDLPYSFILATNTNSGNPNAIEATTATPIPAADGGALIALPVVADNTGSPVTVSFNGGPVLTAKTISGNDVPNAAIVDGMIIWGFKSGDEFRLVTDLSSAGILADAEAAKNDAESARDDAVSAKEDAETARSGAEGHANSAALSASASASSATAAANSASDAASSASAAANSASDAASSASAAASSASAAASSASDAANSASDAAGSEAAAAAAAAGAENARDAAITARNAAQSAQSAAESANSDAEDARDAAIAAQNAAQAAQSSAEHYAYAASLSSLEAGNFESAAANSASAAATSASNAAGSASAAASSAGSASTSATEAANSASAAAASAAGAEAAKDDAESAASDAQDALSTAQSIYANMSGGQTGQFLMKQSNDDYDYAWGDVAGGGIMLPAIYDPNGVEADAFNMDNMVEGASNKILTAAERTAIAANTSARHSHSNKSILDATEQAFTTALKSKLDGIEAGAQVNAVTSVAGKTGAVTLSASDISGLGNSATRNVGTTSGTVAAGNDARITGAVQKANDTGLGGFTAASKALATSGTINISPTNGNIQHCAKTAAVTLNAPTASGVYTIIVEVHNTNATGAVTLSGFTKVDGDAFTTTSGHKFQVFIAKTNSAVTATVRALQ